MPKNGVLVKMVLLLLFWDYEIYNEYCMLIIFRMLLQLSAYQITRNSPKVHHSDFHQNSSNIRYYLK